MMIIISFPFLVCILLSGSEQAEWDPGCCQGYWHKDGGRAGGLHGWDRHSGLLQPPSHCQTAGRLLLWRQTLGKEAYWEKKVFSCGLYWSAAKETRRQWTVNTHRHKRIITNCYDSTDTLLKLFVSTSQVKKHAIEFGHILSSLSSVISANREFRHSPFFLVIQSGDLILHAVRGPRTIRR